MDFAEGDAKLITTPTGPQKRKNKAYARKKWK